MNTCSRLSLSILVVLLFAACLPHQLYAQTIRLWNPLSLTGNKLWHDSGNWIEIGFPSSTEVAKFENSTDSVFISTNETVTGLILNGGTIAGTGSIVVSDSMNWNGGKLTGSGTITFQSGSTAKITGSSGIAASLNGWTLTNNGAVDLETNLIADGNLELNPGSIVSGIGWVILSDTLMVDGLVTVSKLELLSTAVITGIGTLEISDSLKWDGAIFTGGGTLRILNGAVATLVTNEGTLDGWTFDNDGSVVQEIDLSLLDGTVTNDGTYELHASLHSAGGTNAFTNSGILNIGSGSGSIDIPFNTSGTVNLQGGSADIVGGGTASGIFTIGEGDSIHFVESASIFNGPTFSGPGWLYVDNAVTVNNNVMVSKFDFAGYGGSLTGLATVEVTDSMRWGGGRLNGTGELIIASSAILTTPPGIDSYLNINDHTLTNHGTVIQMTSIDANGNAQINNDGSFRIENASVFNFEGSPGPVFNNTGQFEFSDAEDIAEFQIPFNNSGSVEVLDGILSLEAGGISSGAFSIVDTAVLVFPSGFYQMNTGTGVSGDGYLKVDGATLSLNGPVAMSKFDMDSGYVEGNGTLTVLDTLNWGSGTLGGAGEVVISAEGAMVIKAGLRAGARNLDTRTLNNMGVVVQRADFNVKHVASILNSGTYQLMGNHVIVADTASELSFFRNAGNFEKLSVPVNGGNDGRIEIGFRNDANLLIEQSSSLELKGDFPNLSDKALSGGGYIIDGTFIIPGDIDTNYAYITLSGSILNSAGSPALSKFEMNKGEFTLGGELFLTINDSLTNEGVFTIEPGCSLSVEKFTQANGTTYFRGGSNGGLNPNGSIVEVTGGSFYGNGTIYGELHNSADLFIGDTVGMLSLSGFIQSPTGVLHVDIGGTTEGVDLDNVSLPGGLATLDGTVKAKFINGFLPTIEQRVFPIVYHGGRDSIFDAVVDLDVGDGIRLIADYLDNSVTNLVANFAPVFTQTLSDTTINENQTLVFPFLAEDPEESSVVFSLVSPLLGATVDSLSGSFSWTPNFDQSGVHEIVVAVHDAFETTLDTVLVTVQHVNRLPFFTNLFPDTTIAEGQELVYGLEGADPDLDPLLFQLVEWPDGAAISDTGLFTWTPSFSDSGSHTVVISLGDGTGTILDTAFVFVTNTNIPPVFVLNLPDTTIQENSTFTFSVTGSDFDLNALSFAKSAGPAGLSVSAAGEVEWATSYDDSGTYNVVLSLFDGLATVLDTSTVVVSNVNRLPFLTSVLPDTSVAENQLLSYTVEGIDPDNDLLLFDLVQGPTGAVISAAGEFTWTPTYSDSGLHTVVFSIGDGLGSILDTAIVFVSNTNVPPVFVIQLPDTTIYENSVFNVSVAGSDFDLNALSFAKYDGPGELTVSSSGEVEWTVSHGDSGTHIVVVSLSDGIASVLDTANIIVANVNQLPSLVLSLPDTMIAEAQSLSFTVSAVDPDSDPVSFSMVSGPEGADITTGGLFSWTPTYSDSGEHTIIVSIGDGIGSILDTGFVFVSNVNIAPVFVRGLPDTTIQENTTFSFTVTGSDFDLNLLTFAKYEGPAGLTVSSTGEVEWTTSHGDSGTYTVVVSLTDGLASALDTARIIVANVNRLPVLTLSLPDTAIAEAQSLLYTVTASDPDSDPVSFSIAAGPVGANITQSGEFSWTPSYSDSGNHTVIISLSDGLSAVADTAFIFVVNVNRLPIITAGLPDTSIAEKDPLEFTVIANDPDGVLLAFSLIDGPVGASLTAGGFFSWTPSYLQAGVDTVVIGITDGIDIVQDTALVTVLNINRLPGVFSLLTPANNDTVQLALPLMIDFLWANSIDPDSDDTLRYLIRIQGPSLDTTVVVETDTIVSLNLMGRLQAASQYSWSVRVTDLIDSVNAQQGFSFRTSATVTAVGDDRGATPMVFALGQNYPNPFNPSTTIAYDLPSTSGVTIQVFNILGQVIATLVDNQQSAGRYSIIWNGKSDRGGQVSSGIYFYRIHAKTAGGDGREFVQTRKLMMVK